MTLALVPSVPGYEAYARIQRGAIRSLARK